MSTPSIRRLPGDAVLDAAIHRQVSALVAAAEHADGISPLDDQVLLDLEHSAQATHLVAADGSTLVGYGHVDLRSADSASGHLVVDPSRRRQGIGSALAESMLDLADDRPLSCWAHGNVESAAGFAASLGWTSVRELRQLRLPSSTSIPAPAYTEGVTVRTFEPGRDEEAWVAVNAAAFASHPEQGRMTVDDLVQREQQPWFDPAGLFLAERDGELLGSHWTKVHRHDEAEPYGEVYVVGVAPAAQGLGLGKALTLTGLQHLREHGLDVILYVDADNTAAVRLYEGLGFETVRVDVQYAPRP